MAVTPTSPYQIKYFEDPKATVNVLNKILKKCIIEHQDMYEGGSFKLLEVKDTVGARAILKDIIADIDLYISMHNSKHLPADKACISLGMLHQDHTEYFDWRNEIMWDYNTNKFALAQDINDK